MVNKRSAIHLQGLNGLRALAALSVLIHHITISLDKFGLNRYILGAKYNGAPAGWALGDFGVSIFFVLSGFLITFLLLREKETAGISIKNFYIRRILRIWPLYYLYMAICMGIYLYVGISPQPGNIALYVFFAANVPFMLSNSLPFLAHYWSLGVEEQFYLFWPWVVKKNGKRLFQVVGGLIVLLMALKLVFRMFLPEGNNSVLYQAMYITRFHCMMIGAAGAVLFHARHPLFIKLTTSKLSQVFAWGVIVFIAVNQFHIVSVLDHELVSLITVILIVSQIHGARKIVSLEHNVFDFFGKISYGMYVIHPLIIYVASNVFRDIEMSRVVKYTVVYSSIIAVTILLSYLSYAYFEKWFLKWKLKYSLIKTYDTNETSDIGKIKLCKVPA